MKIKLLFFKTPILYPCLLFEIQNWASGPLFFQAFQTFDSEKTHTITQSEFKRALESFCIPLTDDQFEQLIRKVTVTTKKNTQSLVQLQMKTLKGLHAQNDCFFNEYGEKLNYHSIDCPINSYC